MTTYALRPAYDLDDHDRTFRSALMTFEGAESRWSALVAHGATDAEIRAHLSEALGICGGGSGFGGFGQSHRGGKNPAIWIERRIGGRVADRKPTFTGQALIDKTREVLAIGHPTGGVS